MFPRLFVAVVALAPLHALSQTEPPPDDEWGEDEGFGEEEPDDFGDDAFAIEDPGIGPIEVAPPSPLSLRGFVRTELALWTERFDDNPFAKARQNLDFVLTGKHRFLQLKAEIHGEYDFAYLYERDSYDEPTLEAYEWQILTRDVYLAFSLGVVELTVGRQIVAWGEGDALSPLDVVNPRDLREPGMADLEDIRLPVLATRVGVFIGDHRIEAMVIHEADFGLRTPPFGPFSPLPELIEGNPLAEQLLAGKTVDYHHRQDRFDIELQQPLLRWVYKGPGLDVGLYGAYVLDKQGVIIFPGPEDVPRIVASDEVQFDLDHQHYGVIGHSGAWAIDTVLLKWEVGAQIERQFNTGREDDFSSLKVDTGSLLDVMLGVTWGPITDLSLALEVHQPIFLDEPENLLFPVDETAIAVRASYVTLKERLKILFAFSMIGLDAQFSERDLRVMDFLIRGEISYNPIDTLWVGLGYISYLPGEDFGPFSGLTSHDRLFMKVRWDFTIL